METESEFVVMMVKCLVLADIVSTAFVVWSEITCRVVFFLLVRRDCLEVILLLRLGMVFLCASKGGELTKALGLMFAVRRKGSMVA